MQSYSNVSAICGQFNIFGSIEPYGEGHINSTYLVTAADKRYILQKINTSVFPDVGALMNNICAVTAFLRAKNMETLTVIPTAAGDNYLYSGGECWRMYEFVENTVTYRAARDLPMFEAVGRALGEFEKALFDFDASALVEIIPNFHNTPVRYKNLTLSASADKVKRKEKCGAELSFVEGKSGTFGAIIDGLDSGLITRGVTHNDTKINNILMDAKTGAVRCLIDLDTVMPGSFLYDFGDAIRFGAATAAEDEPNLDIVHFDIQKYRAFAAGYLSKAVDFLTARELELVPYSAYLMTIECGMRFLTDFLDGDVYFGIKYPEHNLVRARNQFRLAAEMWDSLDQMSELNRKIVKNK